VIGRRSFANGGDFGGQMFFSDPVAQTQHKGVFDGIAQFTHISRPGICQQGLHGLRGEAYNLFNAFASILVNKILNDRRNILESLCQGRTVQREDIDAEKKIFPKKTLADHDLQIFIGGGNDPDINRDRFVISHPFDFFFFQHPQKFYLGRQGDVADFI